MKNKNIFLIGALLLVAISSYAQTSMSLEECVTYAVDNHLSIKNTVLNQKKIKAQTVESRSSGLPQLNGAIQGIGSPKIQSQFVPETFSNPNGNELKVQPLAFSVPYSADASVTATQLLFNNTYFVVLEGAKVYEEISVKQTDMKVEDVKANVTKAYFGALVNQERKELLAANKAQIVKLQSDAEIMVNEGVMEKIELSKLSVSLNNLITEIEKVDAFQRISENLLKFNMGMPISESIILSENLEEVLSKTEVSTASQQNIEERIDFQLLKMQGRINELILSDLKMKILPDANLFGTLGANYGAIKLKENPVFNFKDNWQSYSRVGFQVNVPLFSSGRYRGKIDQAKVDVDMHNNQMEMAKQGYELEYNQHLENFLNYKTSLDRLEKNKDLAQDVYDNAQIKYKNGVGSNYDIVVSETQLKEAQTNYLGAIYDLLITKVDLDKSAGVFK